MTLWQIVSRRIAPYCEEKEHRAVAELILKYVFKIELVNALILDIELTNEQSIRLNQIVEDLSNGDSIQHALGMAEFGNYSFRITKNVLVPRPETYELVEWVINEVPKNACILDIGTGSGCIAISLALALPDAQIYACDISKEALKIARRNADDLGVKVHFFECDILHKDAFKKMPCSLWDVIVSNPPYICQYEKQDMDAVVLDNDPHLALFVEDDKPLLFYDEIAQKGKPHLKENGLLYYEINRAFGAQTLNLLTSYDYNSLELRKDMYGNERFVRGRKT